LFDHVEEYLGLKRFSQMCRHTDLVSFDFIIRGKTARQEDDRHMAATGTLADSLTQLEAVQARHRGISQHNIWPQRLGFVQTIQRITHHHDLKSLAGEGGLDDGLNGKTVFNEQQFHGHTAPFSCRSIVSPWENP
jgi:hypothetical protein